jgi:hypothetical protein
MCDNRLIGGASPTTEVSLDIFIPRLIDLYLQGRFPFDRLIEFYALDEINQACADSEAGRVLKPVSVDPIFELQADHSPRFGRRTATAGSPARANLDLLSITFCY